MKKLVSALFFAALSTSVLAGDGVNSTNLSKNQIEIPDHLSDKVQAYYQFNEGKYDPKNNRYLQSEYLIYLHHAGSDKSDFSESFPYMLRSEFSGLFPKINLLSEDSFSYLLSESNVKFESYLFSPEKYSYHVPLDFLIIWNDYNYVIEETFLGFNLKSSVTRIDCEMIDTRFGGSRYFSIEYSSLGHSIGLSKFVELFDDVLRMNELVIDFGM